MPAIRRLTPEAAEDFRALRLAARASDPGAFAGTLEAEASQPLEWYRQRLAQDAVFGAFTGAAELVGMAGYTSRGCPRGGPEGRAFGVFVHPSQRGRGVGAALMEAVIDHARSQSPRLHLCVIATNTAARGLYERLGFRLVRIAAEAVVRPDGRREDEAHYVLEWA